MSVLDLLCDPRRAAVLDGAAGATRHWERRRVRCTWAKARESGAWTECAAFRPADGVPNLPGCGLSKWPHTRHCPLSLVVGKRGHSGDGCVVAKPFEPSRLTL
jgi:hypothetical protein